MPFVRNPANPPGVGDPGAIDARGSALAEGHVALLRQLAVTVIVVAALASLFALADNLDAAIASATLVWGFRLLAARL